MQICVKIVLAFRSLFCNLVQKHLERKSVIVAHYSSYCIMLMVHFIVLNLFSLQMQGEIIFKALSFESHHLLSKLNSKFNFCYAIPIAADMCLELCLVASHFRKIGIQGWKKLKFDFFWCSSQGLLLPYPIFFDQSLEIFDHQYAQEKLIYHFAFLAW